MQNASEAPFIVKVSINPEGGFFCVSLILILIFLLVNNHVC